MGRKIPAKKHRGVKDPLKQQAERQRSLKNKINAPPSDPDDQPIPKSLLRLFPSVATHTDKHTSTKTPKKKPHHGVNKDFKAVQEKKSGGSVRGLRQLPGESSRAFSLRINSAVKALQGQDDALQYPMDTEEMDEKGEWMAEQRERRRRKQKKNDKNKEDQEEEQTGKKAHRLTLKKAAKKAKVAERSAELAVEAPQYERLAFGEVVHAPPSLPLPRLPKGQRPEGQQPALAPRPGGRQLLLHQLLPGAQPSAPKAKVKASPFLRERQEKLRLAVVDAYRQHKKQHRQALNKV